MMEITSSAFADGRSIPKKYACEGEDISPPLAWRNLPSRAKSLALIVDDPDAPGGMWVHWVVYNIPSSVKQLDEHMKPERETDIGIRQGANDWGRIGYGGPCPPSGTHRYYFKLYALDVMLDLKPGASKSLLMNTMKNHIVEEARLIGNYKRMKPD
ncbi:MAG: YbhB/YbcL family Raf kinase inhibitor-like protein [Syntrophales bacterium]|nr:YbhB/YbcL family Raf kinase inhibitor-like protein [Syntrophales bacterium]